jgi:hypothetical protein
MQFFFRLTKLRLWHRITNIYRKIRENKLQNASRGVLIPVWKTSFGENPPVSFEMLIKAYVSDPAVKAAVDFLADQTVGVGFYTTADIPEAKEIVDNFNENINLDDLLMQIAREIVAFGNSFVEKIEVEKLEELRVLPLTSIEKIIRDKYGIVQGYKQTINFGGATLNPQRIIHFRWNQVNGEAFGTGIIRCLLESLNFGNQETRPSFLAMKASLEKSMITIIQKFAGPTEIWKFPGVADEIVKEYAGILRSMPREGARFVVNTPTEVEVVSVDPRSRFEAYLEHIWNQHCLGLQTPLLKLFTTPGFTEASANAAIEIAERKIVALQRFIKRVVEKEIFAVIVRQAGFEPVEANVRLHWGLPQKPKVETGDLLKAFELGVISIEELRKMLVKTGWELWEAANPASEELNLKTAFRR